MRTFCTVFVLFGILITACREKSSYQDREKAPQPILSSIPLSIDHINLAVANLAMWETYFADSLGFTLKKGRLHPNSIENAFIEFENNTEIELITVTDSLDPLSGWYQQYIAEGGGAAFLALRVEESRWMDTLETRFLNSNVQVKRDDFRYAELLSLVQGEDMPPLFFIYYKHPNAINPETTTHSNQTKGITKVFLPVDETDAPFLAALGWMDSLENFPTRELTISLTEGELVFSFEEEEDHERIQAISVLTENQDLSTTSLPLDKGFQIHYSSEPIEK